MKNKARVLLLLAGVLAFGGAHAASEWNTQDYDLYPGDFNGDGRTDLLYVAKSAEKGSGIALSDGAQLVAGAQVWNANEFGIPWHSNVYTPVIGDYNWDGRADIFMHRQTPGDHFLLLAGAGGLFAGISQTISNTTGGFVWSGDQHRIISVKARNPGSTTNPRGHRLFLQAVSRGGANAIFNTSPSGAAITGAILNSHTWTDGYLGFQWNLKQAIVHSGDFTGDGNGDLLVQAKPDIVMIDYEIPIPVPVYRPQSFGIVYHAIGSAGYMMWNRQRAGVDWSANNSNLVIGDVDGDGRDDVIVQPKRSGPSTYLVRTNASTNQPYLDAPAALSFSGAGSAAGDAYRILSANIDGGTVVGSGVYLQATSSGGTDLIAHSIPSGGGSVSTVAQSQQYQSSPTPGTAVGSIPGAFSVDPSGASSYRIPIEVPPGIAGVKPDLALTYSSRAGNGLVGVGWTVSGLSAITRCAKTFDQDGKTDGVDLDADDAYCLDGVRLKSVAGENGGLDTEYRTEIESFQKVQSSGGVAHDPGSWTVRDKAGLIRYYGTSPDSRIELQGRTQAHVWAVKRIEDRYGNSIDYSYAENNASSSFVPTDIRWGRNGNVVGRVHFEYWSTRADATSGYLAGSVIGNQKLLRSIDVFSRPSATVAAAEATSRVRAYFLNYEASPNSQLTHLKEVVLCDSGDGASRRCLGSTKFRWQHGMPGFANPQTINVPADAANLRPIDLNSDGRTDYVWSYGGSARADYWAYAITGAGGGGGAGTRNAPWNAIVIDYNSDGHSDLLQTTNYGGVGVYEWITGSVNGLSVNTTSITAYAHTHASTATAVGDYDGDGTQDLAWAPQTVPSSNLQVHLNQPGGFTAHNSTNYFSIALGGTPLVAEGLGPWDMPHYGDQSAVHAINFDGDGRDDLLVRVGTGCVRTGGGRVPYRYSCSGQRYNIYSYDSSAGALALVWSHVTDAGNPEWQRLKVLDANGDGLSDVLYATASDWRLRVSTGSAGQGLVPAWSAGAFTGVFRVYDPELRRYRNEQLSITLDAWRLRYAQIADYDRDGSADVMFPESTSNTWFVLRNAHAAGGFQPSGVNTSVPTDGYDHAMFVDDQGDGLADLSYYFSGSYKTRLGRAPAVSGVIDRITDGLGAVTQVQYGPVTELNGNGAHTLYEGHTNVYEADGSEAAPSFPYQHLLAPLPVVAQIAQDNGLGASGTNFVHTSYKYAGLKAHRRGRGLLGFAKVTVQNVNSKIVTESRAAQRWPYTGMATFSEQRRSSSTIVNSAANLTLAYGPECDTDYWCQVARAMPPFEITLEIPLVTTVNTLSNLSWPASGRWFPYSLTSDETTYSPNSLGGPLKRMTTEYLGQGGSASTNRFDDYGNPYYIKVTVDDGEGGDPHVTSTANAYYNDSTNWCLGRLTTVNVTHSKSVGLAGNPGAQSIPRNSSFTYRAAPYCDLDVETIEPGTPLEQWTDHDYDGYGNKSASTVGGYGVPIEEQRRTTADYTATQGQFANQIGNALGHNEQITWDARFGAKVNVTGPNGLTSTVTTDSFGRVTSETPLQGLGVYKNTTLYWCAYTGCYDPRSVTVITGSGSDGSQVRTEFDRLNRETRTGKLTLDGRWLWTEKYYDPLGREYLASQPYFDAARKCWTFRRFDLLGRVTYQRDPYKTGDNSDGECGAAAPPHSATDADLPGGTNGGRITQIEHDLVDGSLIGTRTTAHANDATAKRVGLKWVNVFGRTRAVQDQITTNACANSSTSSAACLATFYDHDAQGNLTLVRQSGQLATGASTTAVTIDTTASFNERGFKTGMTDPNMGSWIYEYNAFGELTAQTDAKNQRTTLHYDKLGRMDWRTEPGEGTTNWYYDQISIGGAKAIGKLTQVVGPASAYEERYVYDDQGRLVSTKRKIDGVWHRIDQTYDAQSRLDLLKYPSWTSQANPDSTPADSERVVLRHNYNAYGFLTSTQNAATGTTHWRVDTVDQYGVTQETFGNGVVTKRVFEAATGYLRSVTAGLGSATAVQNMSFGFDRNGNLLKRADANVSRSEDFTYDEIDRLTYTRLFNNVSWSGTPTSSEGMSYDVFGNIRSKGGSYSNYNYLADTSGATLCNAPANPTTQPHAVRQLVAGGATRTLCYDRNGNVTRQLNGQYDNVTWWVSNLARRISKGADYAEFTYAPDRARYKQVAVKGGVTETTLYVGGLYERVTKSGVTEHSYYIKGGSGVVAIAKCTTGCSSPTTKYVHRDHLGSIVALSDGAGVVASQDRMSFDAWGKRRANTWAATAPGAQLPISSYTSHTKRGFTGHEHLDFLGVVHMNGRVYDSEIGRFLSADPFVQFPESTQGLNRYSYVDNNPLSYTDPSGFLKFREVLGKIVAAIVYYYTGNQYLAAFVDGFISGNGDIRAGMRAVGFVVIGNYLPPQLRLLVRVYSSPIGQGIRAEMQGGDFWKAFRDAAALATVGAAVDAMLKPRSVRVANIIRDATLGFTNVAPGGVSDGAADKMSNGSDSDAMSDALISPSEEVDPDQAEPIGEDSTGRKFYETYQGRPVYNPNPRSDAYERMRDGEGWIWADRRYVSQVKVFGRSGFELSHASNICVATCIAKDVLMDQPPELAAEQGAKTLRDYGEYTMRSNYGDRHLYGGGWLMKEAGDTTLKVMKTLKPLEILNATFNTQWQCAAECVQKQEFKSQKVGW